MSWPSPPYPFANAVTPEITTYLDVMFNQCGAMLQIPCTAAGTNALSLTPNVNCPALNSYNELGGYRFVAINTSTAAVTAQYNGLGFLPVYHGDGVTQAGTADIVIGQQYIFTFHQTLNGGAGGFYFESPSQPVPVSTWGAPGGRLTTNPGVPVNFSTTGVSGNIYYAPYVHPFVPLFSGTNVQMYQFSAPLNDHVGLTLNMNGSASFPAGAVFDIFVILNAGVLTLAALQWTNTTTRAMTLSVFGGFLTNSGATNMLISPAGTPSTVAVAANQATFLGSVYTVTNGQTQWQFPAGNTAGSFCLSNYYNRVLHTGTVTDSGGSYTYTASTTRQAGGRAYNQIGILQTSSERAIWLSYNGSQLAAAAGGIASIGIGVNNTAANAASILHQTEGAAGINFGIIVPLALSATGLYNFSANEASDGTHATTFDQFNANQLSFMAWL